MLKEEKKEIKSEKREKICLNNVIKTEINLLKFFLNYLFLLIENGLWKTAQIHLLCLMFILKCFKQNFIQAFVV